jgi:electron transfer flavoprotein alpha subunit
MVEKGVLVLGESLTGKLSSITGELLGCGRGLAQKLGEELSAALLGSGVESLARDAIALGADRVFVVDDPLLESYEGEAYSAALERVVQAAAPRVLLLGQTGAGRDLAPRLAFRLATGLATDCVDLDVDPHTGELIQTRPAYGGNVRAVFASEGRPQMATVRAKAMAPLGRDDARTGDVIRVEAALDPSKIRVRVVKRVEEEVAGVRLEDAPAVVTGGRGVGGPEGFRELEKLAKLLKGAVGATRPAVDSGWVPGTVQIGLTGKVVAPDLYIAVALSGSSQHMAGCSGSKHIVAINRDPEASVFQEAHFGVVGDWRQIVPAFAEKLRELLRG